MGGVMGIAVGVFGIIWTIVAASAGGGVFALFGVVFVGVAVVSAVYNFKNATGKNRYSTYDIVDEGEEPDPLNARFGAKSTEEKPEKADMVKDNAEQDGVEFCPYCGTKVEDEFRYCHKCGKQLPED